jgi:hypothetical protein
MKIKTNNIEKLISKQNNKHLLANSSFEINSLFHGNNATLNINNNKSKLSTSVNNIQSENSSQLKSTDLIKLKNTKINQGVLQGLNIFYRKYQTGFVDVWWLYDDGGLNIFYYFWI